MIMYVFIYNCLDHSDIFSAGIGRTGTMIALDILLDQIHAEGAVDVKQCVTKLNQQRVQMVQTLVYCFPVNVICETLTFIHRI